MTTPDAAMRERAERVAENICIQLGFSIVGHIKKSLQEQILLALREQAAESAQQALGMREA